MINAVKQKLQEGRQVVGCMLGFYSTTVVEILGYSGFDFVVFDNEHGALSWAEIEQMVRVAELARIVPIVRVAYGPSDIQKALDRGAYGIHVPMINTREQAEEVVRRAKFSPAGSRGTAFSAPSARFGLDRGEAYLNNANQEILISVHIETPQSVENVEEIMSVAGIDVCTIGSTDLSVALGHGGESAGRPEVQAAIDRVIACGRKHNVAVGMPAGGEREMQELLARGSRYIVVGITAMLFAKFREIMAAASQPREGAAL